MERLIVVVLLCLSFSLQADVDVGHTPSSYLGVNQHGDDVELENMTGKVVVATFWASWCPPCLKELPILEDIQRQVGKDELEIVAINFKESKKTYNAIKRKLKDLSITLTHDKRGAISKKFDVVAIPHMFIIDKSGKVAYIYRGYGEDSHERIVESLNTLLEHEEK